MKRWSNTKLGWWFWRNFWYRVDWWRGDRKFYKWIKYGVDTKHFLAFQSWEELHEWEDKMLDEYKERAKFKYLLSHIFKGYFDNE